MTGDRTIHTDGGSYIERMTGNYIQGNYYANGQPKTLAVAAAEIQELLQQLESTYSTDTTSGQMLIAAEALKHIENDANLRQRIVNAVREGGLAAFEKAIDNPAGAFLTGAIKGWQDVD